jgi:hypothetical protein
MPRKTFAQRRARNIERRIVDTAWGATLYLYPLEALLWGNPMPLAIDGRKYRRRKKGHRG